VRPRGLAEHFQEQTHRKQNHFARHE
jgi:hypothetical protein